MGYGKVRDQMVGHRAILARQDVDDLSRTVVGVR